MIDFSSIIDLEKAVKIALGKMGEQIVLEVSEARLQSVRPIGRNIVIIKLSEIQNNVWTPEYYIQPIQADYVKKALASAITASSFITKLQEMVDKKGVKIGQNFYRLNDNTISVLKKYLVS